MQIRINLTALDVAAANLKDLSNELKIQKITLN